MSLQKIWIYVAGGIALLLMAAQQFGFFPEDVVTAIEEFSDSISSGIDTVTVEDEFAEEEVTATTEGEESDDTDSATSTDSLYEVVRIIDGDTIEVKQNGSLATVRYIGINAPEIAHPNKAAECYGAEATTANTDMVLGKYVRLVEDVRDTDEYGRLLRYVYQDGVLINQTLVEDGYARSISYPPDTKLQVQFDRAEYLAKRSTVGLWGEACASATAQ